MWCFSALSRRIQSLRSAASNDGRSSGLPPSDDVNVPKRWRLALTREILISSRFDGWGPFPRLDGGTSFSSTVRFREPAYVNAALWLAWDGVYADVGFT